MASPLVTFKAFLAIFIVVHLLTGSTDAALAFIPNSNADVFWGEGMTAHTVGHSRTLVSHSTLARSIADIVAASS